MNNFAKISLTAAVLLAAAALANSRYRHTKGEPPNATTNTGVDARGVEGCRAQVWSDAGDSVGAGIIVYHIKDQYSVDWSPYPSDFNCATTGQTLDGGVRQAFSCPSLESPVSGPLTRYAASIHSVLNVDGGALRNPSLLMECWGKDPGTGGVP